MSAAILAAYDPRSRDRAPVEFGAELAELTGCRLIVASVQAGTPAIARSVTGGLQYAVARVDEDLVIDCSEALDELQPGLRERGIAFECRRIDGLSAARGLQHVAEAEDVVLLAVGTGRRPLLGSTAQRVLHGAPCPVAAVRQDWRPRPWQTIAAAVAGAHEDREVIGAAHKLARHAHARLRVLTVVQPTLAMYAWTEAGTAIRPARDIDDIEGEYRALAERELRQAVAGVDDVETDVSAFVGDPTEVIVEISPRLDLLVCGSRGYGPLRAVLLGSVSRRLVTESRCPVVVLPRGVTGALERLFAGAAAAAG